MIDTAYLKTIADELQKQEEMDDAIRKILSKSLELDSTTKSAGYLAYATFALEVGVSIFNLFRSISTANSKRNFRVVNDLVFGLNANDFWVKNVNTLMPALSISINAFRDSVQLQLEKNVTQDYAIHGILINAAQAIPLEIFSLILYLVGGNSLLNEKSLPLKLELAPYFLR